MSTLIVEADGGSRGNPGPAAYGAVVRAAGTREVLAEAGEEIGVATNNVAEYRGLIAGLRMAQAIDRDAVVEARLDSKLVVEQMSGRWKIKHPDMRPLALEAQRIFPPEQVRYTWVPRSENAHADRLLNDALDGKPLAPPSPQRLRKKGGGSAVAGDDVAEDPGEAEGARPRNRLLGWSADVEPPTTLVLVRHGQTALTVARAFSGGALDGPPLDEVGRAQADQAAAMLAGSHLLAGAAPVVVASPTLRTRQTAEAIATRLDVEKITVEDQWRECSFGVWEGLTFGEVGARYPDDVTAWLGSTSFRIPGGESLDEMTERVTDAQNQTVARHPGQVVIVVTHSMPVRALVRLALEAPPSAMFRLRPAPGSVTELQHYSDGTVALGGFNHRP